MAVAVRLGAARLRRQRVGSAQLLVTRRTPAAATAPPRSSDPYGPLHPRPIGKLGGDLRTPVSAGKASTRGVIVDTIIGDLMAAPADGHSVHSQRLGCG